jgi:hypothetical protein
VLLSGIPIVVSALPFHLACRVSSDRACARPQSARVEAATFPFMDVLKCRMTAAKPVPGARPASTPIAPFRTCHELTRKPAHRVDGFFAARADGLLRASGAGDVKIAA